MLSFGFRSSLLLGVSYSIKNAVITYSRGLQVCRQRHAGANVHVVQGWERKHVPIAKYHQVQAN